MQIKPEVLLLLALDARNCLQIAIFVKVVTSTVLLLYSTLLKQLEMVQKVMSSQNCYTFNVQGRQIGLLDKACVNTHIIIRTHGHASCSFCG